MHATALLATLFATSAFASPVISTNPNFPPGTDVTKVDAGGWQKSSKWHGPTELKETSPASNARLVSQGAYACNDPGFTGTCTYITPVPGNCYIYPPNEIQNDKITAFGPDPNIGCQVWEHNYSGKTAVLFYPGYSDLRVIGMDDMISSFCCWWV